MENEKMNEMKPEKKKKGKKILLIVGLSILGLLLALMIAGLIFGKSLLGMIGRLDPDETISQSEIDAILDETDPVDPDFTGPVMDENDVETPDETVKPVELSDNIINFMLVGQDRRPGQGRQRSDSMILVTINVEKKTLTMTSFMRDLWIKIPGKFYERLNVPYAIGGFKLLNATMEDQFGVHVDHNVEVDFTGFEGVIDKVGGVEITLTKSEAGYMNKSNDEWSFEAGTYTLNGEQALCYARNRKIGSEFKRTQRQRTILNEVFKKIKNLSLTEMYDLAEEILPLIKTDMTDSEIMKYILELSKILPEIEIVSQRIPVDDGYQLTMIKKKSVIYLNKKHWKKNLDFLRETIGE